MSEKSPVISRRGLVSMAALAATAAAVEMLKKDDAGPQPNVLSPQPEKEVEKSKSFSLFLFEKFTMDELEEVQKKVKEEEKKYKTIPGRLKALVKNPLIKRWENLVHEIVANPILEIPTADQDNWVKLILAIIEVESSGNPKAHSKSDAHGLMQLITDTAKGIPGWNNTDIINRLENPQENLKAGAWLLKDNFNTYFPEISLTIESYHSGVNRVMNAVAALANLDPNLSQAQKQEISSKFRGVGPDYIQSGSLNIFNVLKQEVKNQLKQSDNDALGENYFYKVAAAAINLFPDDFKDLQTKV